MKTFMEISIRACHQKLYEDYPTYYFLFNHEELKYAFSTEKSYEKVALEISGNFYTHQPRQINSSS